MNSEEINVGDFVEVVRPGRTYDCYRQWADKYGLRNFTKGVSTEIGQQFKVIVKAAHIMYEDTLLGIEDTSGKQFIIGIEGVKKINKPLITLPEKFLMKSKDTSWLTTLSEGGYCCDVTVSKFQYGPHTKERMAKIIEECGFTIETIEEANGVDGSGRPLHFTKEMLKPFMRVKTRNGQMWIVVPNQHRLDFDCDFALCANEEWIEFFAGVGDASSSEHCSFAGTNNGYEAVEVYDMPEYNIDMLVYGAVGKLIWKANEEIPNVENNVPEASGNFEQRLKHIEETLAGVNAKIAELQFLI